MPEPNNFSPTKQFKDVNKRIWNKLIREYFRDVSASDDNLDLTTPRQSLLKACLHKEDDSLLLTVGRMNLFLYATTYLIDRFPVVAGSLLDETDGKITYRPKITLFFRENAEDAEAGYKPVEMEVSFRLVDETTQSITQNKLTTLANKIKTQFGTGQGYLFRKGRKLVHYRQKQKGYDFYVRARELNDGKALIREVLSLNGDTLDSEILQVSEVDDELAAFPYNPGFVNILGKRKNKPRRRPMVNVRFRYAYATIHGYNKPVYLYSRSSYIPDVLVAA